MSGYRGIDEALYRKRDALLRRAAFLEREGVPLFRRRMRRKVFGATLVSMMVASFLVAGVATLLGMPSHEITSGSLVFLLGAFPLATVLSGTLGWGLSRRAPSALSAVPAIQPGASREALFDLEVAEGVLAAYPSKGSSSSFAWLLAGLSFVLPLTLHFIAAICLNATRDFGAWIAASALISFQSHAALAWRSAKFAKLITSETDVHVHREWLKALGITVLVSSLPWIFLIGVPSIITAITGIAFIPFMFIVARRRAVADGILECNLERAAGDLPADGEVANPSLEAPVTYRIEGGDAVLTSALGRPAAFAAEEEDADHRRDEHRRA